MKKIKLLIILTLISITSFANKKLQDFSIVLDWYPNAIHSFLYVAQEEGYFQEEGINLIIHYPANVSDGLSLPAAKRANVGIYYLHSLIQAKANEKIPVVSIGALTQAPLNIVMALKENNIKRPRDLEGKKIGYSGGPLSEAMLKTMIEEDGGNLKDVEVVDVGFDLLTSTITRRVDATIGSVYNHEVPVMEDKGLEVDYFFPNEYGVPNYYEFILVANEDMVKKEKELYNGFIRAIEKGFKFTKNNPERSLEILLENQEQDQFPLKKSVEEKSLKILIPLMENENAKFLSQDKKVWEDSINWMYDKKIIKKKINVEDIIKDI